MRGTSNTKGGITRHNTTNDNLSHPLYYQFKKVMNAEERKFKTINVHCDLLQTNVKNLQLMLDKLNQRFTNYFENRGNQQIQTLKDKQNSFIIEELNHKIKKLIIKENDLNEQLSSAKASISKLQESISYQQKKQQTQNIEIQNLNKKILQKNNKIQQLNKKIIVLNQQIQTNPKIQSEDISKYKLKQFQYQQLLSNLKEIEGELDGQIEKLKQKNSKLQQQIKMIKQEKQKNQSKLNANIYQLDIKLKQQKKITKELEDSHNMLLAKSSQNQISLHQQIMNLKKHINQQKKQSKNMNKKYHLALVEMAKSLLLKPPILHSNKITEQIQQIGKQIIRHNKKITQQTKQINIEQLNKLKQEIDKRDKIIQSYQQKHKNDKSGSQSNLQINISTHKSSDKDQEKFKIKLQSLKKQIKAKQLQIYQIQQELDNQFNQSTQKLLKIEKQYLIKNNQCRKKDQQIEQYVVQIENLKKKIQMSQKNKQDLKNIHSNNKIAIQKSWKERFAKLQQTITKLKISLKQVEYKQQQSTNKYTKLKNKLQKQQNQFNEIIKVKNQKIQELTKKYQALMVENKVNQQKLSLQLDKKLQSSTQVTPNTDLIQQIQMERDRVLEDYELKINELNTLENQKKNLIKKIKKLEENFQEQKINTQKAKTKLENIKNQYEISKKQFKQKLFNDEKEHHTAFIQLKKQYDKMAQGLKNIEGSLQKKKKQYQEAIKSRDKYKSQATSYKTQIDKANSKIKQLQYILKKLQEQKSNIVQEYKLKISEQAIKVQQLVKIVNYKNSCVDDSMRESIKGQKIAYIKVDTQQVGINTQPQQKKAKNQLLSCDSTLVRNNKSNYKSEINQQQKIQLKGNLFVDLQLNNQNNFQICQQGQQINIGQTQQNLRIKELFNKLRLQIQKILNQQQPSLSILKILPFQLQDDYNDFITYIKEKINQIRNQNQVSFINVVIGNQPDCSQASLDLPDLITANSENHFKKIIQEKQAVIHSLIAEKTQQQNTINQLTMEKEQIEEQNENRFMNQCNIYKKQIKQHKKTLDILQMNYQSIKNLLKNVCEIWVSEEDMVDDLRDNMELYGKVAKLNQKERSRLNYYIVRYKQVKGFEQ